MGRVDQGLVGQRQQFLPQGIVEHAGEVGGRHAHGCHEIRTPDVSDEQRVSRQDGVGMLGVLREMVDKNRNRFRRMTGCLQNFEADLAKCQRVTLSKSPEL